MWVLGIGFRTSGRATSTLKHRVISLAPGFVFTIILGQCGKQKAICSFQSWIFINFLVSYGQVIFTSLCLKFPYL